MDHEDKSVSRLDIFYLFPVDYKIYYLICFPKLLWIKILTTINSDAARHYFKFKTKFLTNFKKFVSPSTHRISSVSSA